MNLGCIDDDGSPIRPQRPFGQGACHNHALARQTANLPPRGFCSAHLDGVLVLKRVGVGAVPVVGYRANRGVEDQEVDDLWTIAASDTLVVGWTGERALNQASGESDGSGPIMVTGISETRSRGAWRAGCK